MTPNWPELWALEPGLRPEGLYYEADPHTDQSVRVEMAWTHEAIEECVGHGLERIGRGVVEESVAAALCRDAAVRWLAAHDAVVIVEVMAAKDNDPTRTCWAHLAPDGFVVWIRWETEPPDAVKVDEWLQYDDDCVVTGHGGATLDAALFAACKAVLDAMPR